MLVQRWSCLETYVKMRQGIDTVERLVHRPTELDTDIPSTGEQVRICSLYQDEARQIKAVLPQGLQSLCLAQGQEEQSIKELAAADAVQVGFVRRLSLVAGTQGIKRYVSEVFRIVIFTRDEGLQAACQPVYWRVEGGVVLVGEDNVEIAIQLGGSQRPEVVGDERQADELWLMALRLWFSEMPLERPDGAGARAGGRGPRLALT